MKSTHPIEQDELMAYLDGELEAERASIAAAHLERCKECQKLAADLRFVSQKLMEWEAPPSDSQLPSELAAALADEDAQAPATQKSQTLRVQKNWREILRTPRFWGYGVAGAALGVILIMVTAPRLRRDQVETFYAPSSYAPAASKPQAALKPQSGYADSFNNADRTGSYSYDSGNSFTTSFATNPPSPQQSVGALPSSGGNPSQAGKEQRHESVIPAGPMVVRTAEIVLIAPDVEQSRKSLEETVRRHRGYFGNMTTGGAADAGRSLDAVLRVPADQLDSSLAELKKMGRVESESQKGDEVTQQYVDLQARLTNARNTEQRLTDLLRQRTGKLSDVLEVEEQIDAVRERIEQMDAEKKTLANQVAFATLTLKIREDYKAHVQMVPPSTSSRIRNAAVEGYESMVGGLISIVLFLASWGPTLLLWSMILFFPVRGIWRKVRRTRAA